MTTLKQGKADNTTLRNLGKDLNSLLVGSGIAPISTGVKGKDHSVSQSKKLKAGVYALAVKTGNEAILKLDSNQILIGKKTLDERTENPQGFQQMFQKPTIVSLGITSKNYADQINAIVLDKDKSRDEQYDAAVDIMTKVKAALGAKGKWTKHSKDKDGKTISKGTRTKLIIADVVSEINIRAPTKANTKGDQKVSNKLVSKILSGVSFADVATPKKKKKSNITGLEDLMPSSSSSSSSTV